MNEITRLHKTRSSELYFETAIPIDFGRHKTELKENASKILVRRRTIASGLAIPTMYYVRVITAVTIYTNDKKGTKTTENINLLATLGNAVSIPHHWLASILQVCGDFEHSVQG